MAERIEMAQQAKTIPILIVDDDQVSVMAIKRAMKQMNLSNPLRVASDGLQALEILRGEAGLAQLAPPYIVLLDINMPRMNGHEFLGEIRNDPKLNRALVFVLTTSDAPEDIARAYDRNIAGYIIKDDILTPFNRTLEVVDLYARVIVFPN